MKGCMLIHGFTGSPYELEPLAHYLREATDWKIYTPTLAGHEQPEALRETDWRDWIISAERALRAASKECTELYVIGFSMGGLIAGYLASKYPLAKLVLLSPAVYYPHPPNLVKVGTELMRDYFHNEEEKSAESLENYKRKLRSTPLKAVVNFSQLVRKIRPKIKEIETPLLVIHGEKDHLASPRSAYYVYENVKSEHKEIFLLKNSKHIICHDCEQELVISKVGEFLLEQQDSPSIHIH